MINWSKVKKFREGGFANMAEEDLIGAGRTTTMLINMLDYIYRAKNMPGVGVVVIVAVSDLVPNFKSAVRDLVSEMGMHITRETTDVLDVNGHPVFFCGMGSPAWRGRGAEVFVDHAVLLKNPNWPRDKGPA